jgi:hypothetical protein
MSPILGQVFTAETYAITCWYLWWERRQEVNGEVVQPERRSSLAINSLIANYRGAHSPRAKPKRATWTKTPMDCVRVNVDASFDEDSLRGTTRAVICDSKGQFVAASNTKVEHVVDAL